jgi:pilus assembly protein CpaB
MRPARILLLLVALIAGGLAAFLATRGGTPPQTVVETVAVPQHTETQVLVAKQPIGVGQRLDAASVEWQDWPESAVRPEYITSAKSPDAPAKIAGAVARFEIFDGEPILDAKLAHTDQGYLSAVLDPGMRGVSISISPAAGSGGFIVPNDRVDVVVTNNTGGQPSTHVVLSDVKVLAIGTRLGQTGKTGAPANPDDPKSQVFTSDAIATLELSPAQAQTLMTASASGKLSLVLRSVADFGAPATRLASAPADDQQIRIIRAGIATNVAPGSVDQGQATVSATAYVPPPATTVVETPAPAQVTVESSSAPAAVATPAASAPAASPSTAGGSVVPQTVPTIQ